LTEIIFELFFPIILLVLLLIILISGMNNEYKETELMDLDEFIIDWLLDHGQGHEMEKQFKRVKSEPTGKLYMPITYKGARFFMKLRATPNKISLINLILSFYIFYTSVMGSKGHSLNLFTEQPIFGSLFIITSLLVLGAGIIDGIDGAIARLSNTKSKSGAWFDNVIDRISDILMLVGLIPGNILILQNYGLDFSWVVWTNILLIHLYEYMRARHEGLGLHQVRPYIAERPMRVIILSTFFMIYGISSISVFFTNLINPALNVIWSISHPAVITWCILISQFTLFVIMVVCCIQLGNYSYKNLKRIEN